MSSVSQARKHGQFDYYLGLPKSFRLELHTLLNVLTSILPSISSPPISACPTQTYSRTAANTPHRHPRRESASNTHVGRGGAANIFKPSAAELEGAKKDGAKWESAIGDEGSEDGRTGLVVVNGKANGGGVGKGGVNGTGKGDEDRSKGLADRGKEWLMGKFGK